MSCLKDQAQGLTAHILASRVSFARRTSPWRALNIRMWRPIGFQETVRASRHARVHKLDLRYTCELKVSYCSNLSISFAFACALLMFSRSTECVLYYPILSYPILPCGLLILRVLCAKCVHHNDGYPTVLCLKRTNEHDEKQLDMKYML
jgi:hypothetical protein